MTRHRVFSASSTVIDEVCFSYLRILALVYASSSLWIRVESAASLIMSSNSPTVWGSKCGFSAKVYDPDREPSDEYKFSWSDNYRGPNGNNKVTIPSQELSSSIEFRYDIPGEYRMSLEVTKKKFSLFDWKVASGVIDFQVTEFLNGKLTAWQNGEKLAKDSSGVYLGSSRNPTTFKVELHDPYEYMSKANMVSFLWTVNDNLMYSSSDFNITLNLTDIRLTKVHVTVSAFFNQPTTTSSTTTTTTTSTTTTPATTTTTIPTTATTNATAASPLTTTSPTTAGSISVQATSPTSVSKVTTGAVSTLANPSVASVVPQRSKRESAAGERSKRELTAGSILKSLKSLLLPPPGVDGKDHLYELAASPPDPSAPFVIYGDFETTVDVSDPIDNVTVVGDNWLRRGSLLRLNVSCLGSGPWTYCTQAHDGPYNVTGNETCLVPLTLYVCEFGLVHYFPGTGAYTMVIILKNAISRTVKSIAVNVYDVASEPQLSTIIVPIVGCVLAVVFVIFGLAYYFQNRNRFLVEEADFDFQAGGEAEDDGVPDGFWERVREEFRLLFRKPYDDDMIRPSTYGRAGRRGTLSGSSQYGAID